MSEQIMLFVASVFKGITLNKKMRLEHESLRHPETRILKYHGYMTLVQKFVIKNSSNIAQKNKKQR